MGSSSSKPTTSNEALVLCKERMHYIKRAIDARNSLSAAHLLYIRSLRSTGNALRRYAEPDLSVESSISASEVEKSPSHSSYASPSPSREHAAASPQLANASYMRATKSASVTVTVEREAAHFVEHESLRSPPPPLPPVSLESNSSWDFFDPIDAISFSSRLKGLRQVREAEVVPLIEEETKKSHEMQEEVVDMYGSIIDEALGDEGEEEVLAEREDAAEYITHRAKDFLSSMRDIEHRFLRAAEAGNEMSRMLETNKIRLSICSDLSGRPPTSRFLTAFHRVCCNGETPLNQESTQNATKVITWNRSVSSLSSSSKNPLTSTARDDGGDSSSDFIEEFSMISGSHSSTLNRLYAWERKLYDEIKASECIRKAYDQKCTQLRHQFARDLNAELIDKTRAVVKDLHSRLSVAIQAVDSISKRIERMRDEELLPQLVELIHGLIRMWKNMLECHHSQFITISLAYHAKSSTTSTPPSRDGHRKQALVHLKNELEFFSSSFTNWVDALESYVAALNSWLQKCVLQPQENRRGRRRAIFPPRQALSPPIFVLCSDWLTGMRVVPYDFLRDCVKELTTLLHDFIEKLVEEDKKRKEERGEIGGTEKIENYSKLVSLQASLAKVFDKLAKFSEASLKVYEDVKQGHEIARTAYKNGGI
ncbi:uncharacterized protein LOC109718914 [Ananas comosus]|uniref:Uncharacterized protein LOC109718914 n=1 Tax=Ananas comosus TaxID=4615 RepID=A0A6P5FZH6_ANACO|nr:uncharacterized protein LOC109718914 [Ananas comosus]XP_020100982.1 uncharacterized protein LOC109718914 [Ananas comosus]XP_020100983.1 uncharacterized protein LOC109718914 [Ananas comosus]